MTKKIILRVVAFSLILLSVLFILNDMFEIKNTTIANKRFYSYKNFGKDTVDVIFFGTSGIDRYWIPSQGYEDYGISSYPLSTDGFLSWLYPYVIDEALSKQDASLIVIDIRPFTQGVYTRSTTALDPFARTVLDALPPFSVNRTKAAFKTMDVLHQVDLKKVENGEINADQIPSKFNVSYFFSFIRYHQMWEEKSYKLSDHLGDKPHLYGGFYLSKPDTLSIKPQSPIYRSEKLGKLDAICEQSLYDVINYVKENNLNVLFLNTPQCPTQNECERANTVYKILEQENMNYVHFYDNDSESGFSIDLDIEKDFYDSGHVNYYGATKFTKSFSLYLKEHYELPDRRQDEKVAAQWNNVHDQVLEQVENIKEYQKKKLSDNTTAAANAQSAADRLANEVKQADTAIK